MTPFFFGNAESPLFGCHHPPRVRKQRRAGVLLCPPVGQEYIRTHWTLRQLAGRLTREGYHVLRFDYHGVGDSAGGSGEGSVAQWSGDVSAAAQELRDVSGTRQLSCVGLRLGATLAARAASEGLAMQQLVLWDPVVDGGAHLRQLEALHEAMLVDPMRYPEPRQAGGSEELFGFAFPASLKASLRGLDLRSLKLSGAVRRVVLLVSQRLPAYEELQAALEAQEGLEVIVAQIDDAGEWDVLDRQEETVLAAQIQGRVVEELGQRTMGGWR